MGPVAKMLERGEGTLGGPEAGGGREGRASICAQRRPQRQQISAEQGAHTEEKEMGERPNAQFGMEKKNRSRVQHMERRNKAELAQPANN